MKPSSFQTTIENQFDYICKRAMDDERKDYMKALSRQSKRETLCADRWRRDVHRGHDVYNRTACK